MKYFNIFFIALFLSLAAAVQGFAEHLVGGVLSYTCLGAGTLPNTMNYRFKLNLKRDCKLGGNLFDANVDLGIYQFNGTQYVFSRKTSAPITIQTSIPLNQQSCISLLNGICVDEAIYQIDVQNLPIINQNYLIAFQRCCRNMTISNILDPGRTGSTIMLEITPVAQQSCNQGPTSDLLPPLILCANEDLKLNLASVDSQGDQLTYELCAPLAGGGPAGLGGTAGDPQACNGIIPDPSKCVPPLKEVIFSNTSINALNPFPSSTPITLINGILSARPTSLGQYIFGVCIKEFRNGVLLTSSRRDIQINIAQCNITIQASIQADNITNKVAEITVCDPKNPYKIINQSKDTQYIKSVYWEFTGPKGTKITDTTYNFTRFFIDTGLYVGKMILNKGSQCSDSILIKLRSVSTELYKISAVYDSCSLKPVQFSLNPNVAGFDSIQWDFGDSMRIQNTNNPVHQYDKPGSYNIKVTSASSLKCKTAATTTINFYPTPSDLTLAFNDSLFCYPQSVTLGIKEITDPKYQYAWLLSDGQQFSGPGPKINFTKAGVYTLKLSLTSPSGCKVSRTFNRTITSSEKPTASFDLPGTVLTLKEATILPVNKSIKAKTYLWDFGDHNTSDLLNPSHTYAMIGKYKVTLKAFHENGCVDSTFQSLTVGSVSDFFVPNIFTPNGDGNNDIFVPVGIIGPLLEYEFTVFDRWGSLVFLTTDYLSGWDGRLQKNQNKVATDGVYVYQIKYTTEDGVKRIAKGSVTLIQ